MTDAPNADAVVIERFLEAPIDLVWRMWTEAEHFAAWYGPTGATVQVAEMDLRVGGSRRIAMEMRTPDGAMRMHFVGTHREVDPPTRLVYTETPADEDGTPRAHDGAPLEPGAALTEVIVQLAAVGGGTRMVMTHVGIPADSPGAAGWTMAIDTLEEQLRTVEAG